MFLSTALAIMALDRRGAQLLLQLCSSANSFKFWSEYRMMYCWQWYYHHVSYRGKFLLVKIFVKKCPDSSEEISWFLFSWMWDAPATPLPVDGHASYASRRTLNDEAKKQACATTAQSSFCVGAFAITKVSRLQQWARNWRIGFSTDDLNFNNFIASLTDLLVFCIVAGFLFFTVTI